MSDTESQGSSWVITFVIAIAIFGALYGGALIFGNSLVGGAH